MAPLRQDKNTGPIAVWQVQSNCPERCATEVGGGNALGTIPNLSGHPKSLRTHIAAEEALGEGDVNGVGDDEVAELLLGRDAE